MDPQKNIKGRNGHTHFSVQGLLESASSQKCMYKSPAAQLSETNGNWTVPTEKSNEKKTPRQENKQSQINKNRIWFNFYHLLLLLMKMASLPSNLQVTMRLPSKLNQWTKSIRKSNQSFDRLGFRQKEKVELKLPCKFSRFWVFRIRKWKIAKNRFSCFDSSQDCWLCTTAEKY